MDASNCPWCCLEPHQICKVVSPIAIRGISRARYVICVDSRHGIGVHDWLDDRKLTAMQAKGSLKLVSIPDAFFVLSHRGKYFGHFLEIDTGSVRVGSRRRSRSWTQTIADYGHYFREYYPIDGFFRGFSAPIVLTVTSSSARLEHLLTATKHAGGAGDYWYTTWYTVWTDTQINRPWCHQLRINWRSLPSSRERCNRGLPPQMLRTLRSGAFAGALLH